VRIHVVRDLPVGEILAALEIDFGAALGRGLGLGLGLGLGALGHPALEFVVLATVPLLVIVPLAIGWRMVRRSLRDQSGKRPGDDRNPGR
jgi:membrane protein implicated in regulation of membrane protease activity